MTHTTVNAYRPDGTTAWTVQVPQANTTMVTWLRAEAHKNGYNTTKRFIRNAADLINLMQDIDNGTYEPGSAAELSDADLDGWENGASLGHKNAAPCLRPLHPALRPVAVSEGTITMNMSPGWNFSGAIHQGVREIKAGRCDHIRMNHAVIKNDPYGTKAADAARQGISHATYLESITAGA